MKNPLHQFLKFASVGVVGTAAHFLVLVLLVEGAGSNAVVASSLGALTGALINYILNYHYTFRSTKRHSEALTKFLLIAGIGFILNGILMTLLTEMISIQYFIAQVVTTLTVLVWNFAANRAWTFAHPGN